MFLIEKKDYTIILVYVQPGSQKNQVIGLYGNDHRLKVKIKSRPVDGAANKELINFFSDYFDVKKSQIEILRGDKSRSKDVAVRMPFNHLKLKLAEFI